ncbi:septum site-determining protein [Streptomyces sp. R302]|uniref:TadE/TadG family type IV pilus assembly protein n=1 Tax=unclassified Streptomyces TaxID=2593676 RepID=UPI00145F27CF|nr:septum site-determining protein [Streptomyces sp. R301]NML78775.1 septum site-determining protein [Streptomyces sp. R302]
MRRTGRLRARDGADGTGTGTGAGLARPGGARVLGGRAERCGGAFRRGFGGARGGPPRGGGHGRGDDLRSRTRSSSRVRDRGQAAIEYLGFLPILLLVGLAGLQLGLAAYAAQQAGTAARAAARAATSDEEDAPDASAAARAAVSGWLDVSGGDPTPGDGEVTVTVRIEVPQVVPFWSFDPVERSATMPYTPQEDERP